MEMKFSTNLAAPIDENDPDEEEQAMSQRSMSTGSIKGVDRENQLVAGEIPVVENLTNREKKALTKRLIKQEAEFREHMREVVKDFPTMKETVGGGNFDKAIRETLFSQMEECKESIDGNQEPENEEIVDEFQKFLR